MQALSDAKAGENYTIKWMFGCAGNPEDDRRSDHCSTGYEICTGK